jgi:parallel beta-helix repeat protein
LAIVQPALGVDGVTEINDARATAGGVTPSDSPGFPVTLDHPGSYRLTGNLVVTSGSTSAIVISSGDVTLDLNGFTIACDTGGAPCGEGGGPGDGIDASGQPNIAIVNGTVRGMADNGIVTGINARIEGVRALGNQANGISTSNGSSLIGNTASDNGNDGLTAGVSSTIVNNTMRNNGRGGVETSTGCTIAGNTANNNIVFGIYCNGGCTIDHNTLVENGTGVSLLGGNTIVGNTARNNTMFALVCIGSDSGYSLNTFTGSNGGGDNAQVSGCTPIGANFCGTNTACP